MKIPLSSALSFVFFIGISSATYADEEAVTLEQALADAYRNNPSLEAERAKLRVADEQVALAFSHWLPNVAATASAGKTYQYLPQDPLFGTGNYDATTHSFGVQVTQPLFRGLRTQAETQAAEKQVRAGRAQLQSAEQQLLLDAATAFLDMVRDQAILVFDKENERVLREKLNETNARAHMGDLTKTDQRQAESRLARGETGTLQAENALAADSEAYRRLVGVDPAHLKEPELSPPHLLRVDQVIEIAERRNPSVVAANYVVEGADADIDDNSGGLLPEVDLVGNTSRSYGQSVTTPGRFDSSQILVQLTLPLYPTGAGYSKVRAARQAAVQRRMEAADAVRRARESAHKAWQAYVTNDAVYKADQREITAAAEALKGVRIQSQAGTRTTLDVLNAEQELLDAKTDLAKATHDRDLAVLQIKAAVGDLTADALRLPLDPYDPTVHYNAVRHKLIGFGDADKDVYARFGGPMGAETANSPGLIIPASDTLTAPPGEEGDPKPVITQRPVPEGEEGPTRANAEPNMLLPRLNKTENGK